MNLSNDQRDLMMGLYREVARSAPTVGRLVAILRGKHAGKRGVVVWHGADRFSHAGRYDQNCLQQGMRVAEGRFGFRIGVLTVDGERFFTSAEYALVGLDA